MSALQPNLNASLDLDLNPSQYLQNASLICSALDVTQAIDILAESLNEVYLNDSPIVLCVMNGGLYLTGQLLPKLKFPLELDYVHATRYDVMAGKSLKWLTKPKSSVKDKNILILDDILDEGITLKAIVDECIQLGAKQVNIAVLVDKMLDKEKPIKADYVGLTVPNRYIFGCGMDINGWWRNLPAIYAFNNN